MNDIQTTLNQRQDTHGSYSDNARTCQLLKGIIKGGTNYDSLSHTQKEALDMIVHKIARIINGDAYFLDSWRDVIGYAQLAYDSTKESPLASDVQVTKTIVDDCPF